MVKEDFPGDELAVSKAILYTEDLLESASLPVILIGDTMKKLYKRESIADLKEVEFGIKESDLSEYAQKTMDARQPGWKEGFEHEGIKVVISIIKQDRGLLENPDQIHTWFGIFKTPNPPKKYIRMKGLVK